MTVGTLLDSLEVVEVEHGGRDAWLGDVHGEVVEVARVELAEEAKRHLHLLEHDDVDAIRGLAGREDDGILLVQELDIGCLFPDVVEDVAVGHLARSHAVGDQPLGRE
eukprot:CAMPEP_0119418346 /NCGR_PEP_ID=MMETSP1335-20130426/18017_1 /TAXON_ID=259385 /ORGANISM="Chrysoculter rhomboideus, Strain RCC1486" /LENGTH=107 /DNA_ID=CAMNT_0007443585 /DNA_START=279 /DNA_END=600 /DNA_ORIENTATION=+